MRVHPTIFSFFNLAHISAGFVAVLVGYTSSAVIVFQAAAMAGADASEISSWLWALGIGMGVSSIGLSLYYKMPILTAWSTPGAALLAISLNGTDLSTAIGAFIVSSMLITLCGITGWFEKLVRFLPMPLAAAMLAGVLFQFSIDLFQVLQSDLVLAATMLIVYILAKRWLARYTIPLVLLVGICIVIFEGRLAFDGISLEFSKPIWTTPSFNLHTIIGVSIPLFIVTMASQNVPGIAVLRANNFHPPSSPLISWTGITGLVLAPFGGYAFNLAAITAAICMGEEAGENRKTRYFAAVWAGIFYLFTGIFGATVAMLFAEFPSELVVIVAGLALLGTIGSSLASALVDEQSREAALITFLFTASGISIAGISSAFWGLVAGLAVYWIFKKEVHPHV